MQFTKILGLAAVGAVLALAAQAERANALSLSNPGAAAAVQEDARLATTEVHWRHHRHHRWHRWHHHRSPPPWPSPLAPLVSPTNLAQRSEQARFIAGLFLFEGGP